jgi:hypothetical protein
MRPASAILVAILLLVMTIEAAAQEAARTRWVIAVDRSGSMNEEELTRVLKTLADDFAHSAMLEGLREVAYLELATPVDVLSGTKMSIQLPDPEGGADPVRDRFELAGLFRSAADKQAQIVAEQGARKRRERLETIAELLSPLVNKLRTFDVTQETDVSCVLRSMERLSSEPRTLSIFVTDAADSRCGAFTATFASSRDSAIVVVVVPGRRDGEQTWSKLKERIRQLENHFPGATIVLSNRVGPGWIGTVADTALRSGASITGETEVGL